MGDPQDPLELTEKPLPLRGWEPGSDWLGGLEREIGSLIRQCAEAKFALTEAEQRHAGSLERLLLGLIEAIDAFDRVFGHVRSSEHLLDAPARAWLGNFATIERLLKNLLAQCGVAEMESRGPVFDPQWHTVAETVLDRSRPHGTIIEETHKGYLWRDRVLRKALVKVVRNDQEDGGDEHGQGSRH